MYRVGQTFGNKKKNVQEKIEDIKCWRSPTKGSSYIVEFRVWNPLHANTLNRLVGSRKHWSKRFNADVMGGTKAFIWKPVTTDQIRDAIVATTIKAFNVNYIIPTSINQLSPEKLRRALLRLNNSRFMMIALRKSFLQSVMKTYEEEPRN
ncbi:hypothetical protein B9Z55_013888 [Caenorhabditis nigoni]|uniref:Uncharacterized protein n=1 Tax=Caenorhabditis nigoni TaxID=1611254 RepID=A0A2G5U4I3_9PELO|nr:hypothetical protein B9Z55_013888 [Caenorhabditis nigoni]